MKIKIIIIFCCIILISGFVLSLTFTTSVSKLEVYEDYSEFKIEKVYSDYVTLEKTNCLEWGIPKDEKEIKETDEKSIINIISIEEKPVCLRNKTVQFIIEERNKLEYECFMKIVFTAECDYLSKDGKICYDDDTKRECLIGVWEIVSNDYETIKERI